MNLTPILSNIKAKARDWYRETFGRQCENADCRKRLLFDEIYYLRARTGRSVAVCLDCYKQVKQWDSQVKQKGKTQ